MRSTCFLDQFSVPITKPVSKVGGILTRWNTFFVFVKSSTVLRIPLSTTHFQQRPQSRHPSSPEQPQSSPGVRPSAWCTQRVPSPVHPTQIRHLSAPRIRITMMIAGATVCCAGALRPVVIDVLASNVTSTVKMCDETGGLHGIYLGQE